MTFDELVADHKAQLGKAAERFKALNDADFKRHVRLAARRMNAKTPLWANGTLALSGGQTDYPAPPDLLSVLVSDWGRAGGCGCPRPWDDGFVGFAPRIALADTPSGKVVRLSAAPGAQQLNAWGASLNFQYVASHEISEARITLPDPAKPLVLLAALIEAMRELATETSVEQLHKGLAGVPTAGTPAYLYEKLCQEFERA